MSHPLDYLKCGTRPEVLALEKTIFNNLPYYGKRFKDYMEFNVNPNELDGKYFKPEYFKKRLLKYIKDEIEDYRRLGATKIILNSLYDELDTILSWEDLEKIKDCIVKAERNAEWHSNYFCVCATRMGKYIAVHHKTSNEYQRAIGNVRGIWHKFNFMKDQNHIILNKSV